jgi:ubiquitin-conjugating enzyme E2 O
MAVAVAEEAALIRTNLSTLDLVCFGRRKLLERGLVLSLTEDPDDDEFNILLIDGSRVTKKVRDILGVFDRTLVYVGQIVGSVSDYGGQIGVVTGVTTTLNVVQLNERLGVTKAVNGVSPAALRRVRPLSLGDYVVSGEWLGRVVEVSVDVEVSFDDGAVCRVANAGSKELRPDKSRCFLPQTNPVFYPGARVLTGGDSAGIFTEARWLNGEWSPDREEGKVTKVDMADVLVYWIASAAGHGMESAPPANQNPDNLTFFCSAPDCVWSLGDRCFLDTADINNQQNEQRSPARTPDAMAVSLTTNSVEVLWQDGKRQNIAYSLAVYPVEEFRSELDFLPGQYVVDNSPADDTIIHAAVAVQGTVEEEDVVGAPACRGSKRRVGVVRSQNSKEQMVQVSWFKAAATERESWEVECHDTVSAYDLALDLDHPVFYGDVVVRLRPKRKCTTSAATRGEEHPS